MRANRLVTWISLVLLCLAGMTSLAQAQTGARNVDDIEIRFEGLRNISDEAILARIQVREGSPYNQTLVDRSVRSLYGTGFFESVEAITETTEGGGLRVVFLVRPTLRVQQVVIEGEDRIRERRLRREIETRPGRPLTERQIRADADKMLEYYRKKGFTEAQITYDIERNPDNGYGIVTFNIVEGRKLKIERVEFVGNDAIDDDDLRDEMETRRRWFLSWLTGSGRFNETVLQEDLEKLRRYYLNRGYLDVSIPESGVTLDYPEDDEIVITIRVDEGRRYRVGNITFEGATLFGEDVLFANLDLLSGSFFSPEVLDNDIERLTNLYGVYGHLDTRVRVERRPNLETGNIDLAFSITESEPYEVQSIVIEGNTKTKSTVIIRELALAPGRTFNTVYMRNSEARLRNTRFFEEVNVSPEPTNIPGRRNLKIRVSEARTGNFQIGAGFSTLENIVVFFEVSQSNFDLFKWRSPWLQGDGQKFRLRGSIGSRSNEIVVQFEEPWLFERRLAFGVELYRQESEYNSSFYDELRMGIQLYIRRRLFGLVDGQFSYTYEIVDFQDVSQGAPTLILEEAANSPRSISKFTTTLVRDTRNDLIFTTRGSRVSVSSTFAGIGGDTEYLGLEARGAFYLPTFRFADQVLIVLGRAGSLWGWSGEPVPFFDRYYLGGPNSLRGFDFRDVSPYTFTGTDPTRNSPRAPEGGNSYGFGSLEYTIKVANPLRLAVFYDWGFVNRDEFDFSISNFHDNWGVGIRLLVLGNPLRLDYGIPLTSGQFEEEINDVVPTDSGGQFNFSFGTRF